MPVGATTRRRGRAARTSAREACGVLRRVTRMLHLDAVEAERGERLEPLARAAGAGMREHGETARRVDHRDRVAHPELVLRDVRRTAGAEIAIERVARRRRPSRRRRARARRAGARWRPSPACSEHVVERDLDAERLRAARRCARRGARASRAARRARARARSCRCRCKAEQVRLALAFDRAQLDAVDDAHAELVAGLRALRRVRRRCRDRSARSRRGRRASPRARRPPATRDPSDAVECMCRSTKAPSSPDRTRVTRCSRPRATSRSAATARTGARGPRRSSRRATARASACPCGE